MKRTEEQGFTLLEVVIAMVIAGVVAGAMYAAFNSQQRTNDAQEVIGEMQQNLRAAMGLLARDIRKAGFSEDDDPDARIIAITPPTPNPRSPVLSSPANPAPTTAIVMSGDDDTGQMVTTRYEISLGYVADTNSDPYFDLQRRTQNGAPPAPPALMAGQTPSVVMENIENMELYYTMVGAAGTKTLNPANLANVRSIEVTLLARASRESQGFTNRQRYVTASGAVWGPYNDQFRRRLLITTVKCRNITW